MAYTFILDSDNEEIVWEINLGENSSISVEFFKDNNFNPLDLSSWAIISTIYNPDDHMLFNLDVIVENNVITAYVPEQDTALMNRPNLEKNKILKFDLQGFSETYDFENPNPPGTFFDIIGKVSVTDQNQ